MNAAWLLLLAIAAAGADRTILAVGAHAGDMEITAGAVLATHTERNDRVVLLHLTLGEAGHQKLSPAAYGEQKRREAQAAARVLGAEVIFGPYRDGLLPNDDGARAFVAHVIRDVRPTHVITHWKSSVHKDHQATSAITRDALLLASVETFDPRTPRYRGVRGLYFAENWEDKEGFQPYVYLDVAASVQRWRECVTQYEFIRGGISPFPYLDYYQALARLRGIEAGKKLAVAMDVEPSAKKRVFDTLP